MMNTYYSYLALAGLDDSFAEYISYAQALPQQTSGTVVAKGVSDKATEEYSTELQRAIVKGLGEQAAQITERMLCDTPALQIVQSEIIPALNTVGTGFENKTVFLPQLLMSAEAAKTAFEVIKSTMSSAEAGNRCRIVIATVKGDIHDIGKNIVKLLLENYGFAVTDLGRDVPAEKIVQTTVELHAPIVGLSALMTTTVPAMEETIKQLRVSAPWCRVIVGGAVLNEEYANLIGADKYARDAMETVRYAEEIDALCK